MKFKLCLCRRRPPETCKKMLLLLVFLKWIFLSQSHALITIKLGAVFEQTENSHAIETTFRNAIRQANLKIPTFKINYDIRQIASENSYHANKAACDLVQSGVWALFSSSSSQLSWLLSSFADHFHIPFFKTSSASAFSSNYTFNLYPKKNHLTNAILSLIKSDENLNSQFTFFYQHYQDLAFYKKLFEHSSIFKLVQINSPEYLSTILENCKMAGESRFILALSLNLTQDLLNQAQKLAMITEYHRYILVNLDSSLLDLSHFKNINKNVTWFSLQNVISAIHLKPLEHNLITDAVHFFIDSVRQLNKDTIFPPKTSKTLCTALTKTEDSVNFSIRTRWRSAERLLAKIRQNEFRGTTGSISFDSKNERKTLELAINGLIRQNVEKIGQWNNVNGIQLHETDSNVTRRKQISSKMFRVGIIESMPFVWLDKNLPAHWPMKHRLRGLYVDLIELLQQAIGFADYDLYLLSREDYFNRRINHHRNSTGSSKSGNRQRLAINHRLIDGHIDFVIGELANELDQMYEKSDEQSSDSYLDRVQVESAIAIQPIMSMPISALFVQNSICTSHTSDHLFCSTNQVALNNSQSFFKVFDLTLWTLLIACYFSISLLMFLIVNFGSSFTCSNAITKLDDKSTQATKSSIEQKNEAQLIKSSLKRADHYDQQDHRLSAALPKNRLSREVDKKEENINEDNRVSAAIEQSNSHLSSSAATNEQLVFCGQAGLRLVELGTNLYGTNTLNTTTRQQLIHQPTGLLGEHQLINMDSIQQNQLDAYQLVQQHLNEKQATISNGDLFMHSNLTNLISLNAIDSQTVAAIDHLNNLANGNLNENIEIINNSFAQSLLNIDHNGQLSPYLHLDQLKNEKSNLTLNTMLNDKCANSLLPSGDNGELNQTKAYSPSYIQFQLLNHPGSHQSIISDSIPSIYTTRSNPNNQQPTAQVATSRSSDLMNHLTNSIDHKNGPNTDSSTNQTNQIAGQWRRDHYRSNSIDLTTCFWYSIAIACHQKVPFGRSSFAVVILSSVWRIFTLIFVCLFTANLTAYLNRSNLQSISRLPLVPIILQPDIQIACSFPTACNQFDQFQLSKNRFMQQISEKIIKINSKTVEKALFNRLLYGKTIYLTNHYEANYLASKYCNLTVMKLDSTFLGLNLIEPASKKMEVDKLINYQSKFNLRANRMHSKSEQHGYEFESSELVQNFGLTFRKHSPYFHLFADQIITFSENGLIANLLHKWSRSSIGCDSITSGNLYSNDLDYLNLHNDRRTDSPLNSIKHILLYHASAPNSIQSSIDNDGNMAKLKKLETNNVQNDHSQTPLQHHSVQQSTSTRLANSLSELFQQIGHGSSMNPWMHRIISLLALGLSLTCLLVLGELFVVIVTSNSDQDKDRQIDDHFSAQNDQQYSADKLSSSVEQELNRIVPLDDERFLDDCAQQSTLNRPLNRTLITTIATADILQQHQLEHQNTFEQVNLFNNEHQYQTCDHNLFTSNCSEHYAYHINPTFDDCQINQHQNIKRIDQQTHLDDTVHSDTHLPDSMHRLDADQQPIQQALFQTIVYNHLESSI